MCCRPKAKSKNYRGKKGKIVGGGEKGRLDLYHALVREGYFEKNHVQSIGMLVKKRDFKAWKEQQAGAGEVEMKRH